ncbi:MAG TPA: LacI family DNA-binding transcriptional regulator, partial [Acidothermaceae bacterium]
MVAERPAGQPLQAVPANGVPTNGVPTNGVPTNGVHRGAVGAAAGSESPRVEHRPTVWGVAALAGVSKTTVSRVLTGSPRVSPQARIAVERAIEKLNYVPNRAARALVTRRADTLALIVSEPETRL